MPDVRKITQLSLLTWLRHYSGVQPPDPGRREGVAPNYNLGLRLGSASRINEEDFVGREVELEQLRKWLAHVPNVGT